ncbi:hypothetical protein PHYBLDRAFT_150713 [Phycomyces blakesleeanus NRRL 1555(-)]|uniref:F-box domain-containing protein n=1 Tax=Phycomyces blakesleeanus (strain ATCC 8743b / DSM 1359 / FGSC 10004 / NBRC 33097 / NRRL 1555) TaxID=763407 RepID=A0A167KGH4_PHYB8|nr:hypothetical protein PHYBLDRAFT_150713 [Phycomyces blakesleeanus NRRL 1555(-)]OAD68039.1 hypothetical protein PHYBLDRAFT_150713 [Phycomyces blakesleeanus NRRL 1555(-)]|eukprot:XP_018286079.1 hypothetical protein PHYBLDRAFT_150713 [Phycomyces blakesleeanus NRRL 1555(-)]
MTLRRDSKRKSTTDRDSLRQKLMTTNEEDKASSVLQAKVQYRTTLSDDCLEIIFSYFTDCQELCQIASVSRHWRAIVTDTRRQVWHRIRMSRSFFISKIRFITRNPYAVTHLGQTRVLELYHNLEDEDDEVKDASNMMRGLPRFHNPFENLKQLWLDGMYIQDIICLLRWTSELSVIWCTKIPFHQDFLQFTFFERHQTLEQLCIDFRFETIFDGELFSLSSTETLVNRFRERSNGLPPSLRTLRIRNIVDDVLGDDVLGDEMMLLGKYLPFQFMHSLRSLSIGRCDGWMARVWRECFIPCSTNLENVELLGFVKCDDEDVEAAKADFIANMKRLRRFELMDSEVTQAVMDGLGRLKKDHQIGIQTFSRNGQTHSREGHEVPLTDLHLGYANHLTLWLRVF